jgi:hypothetical protein
MDALRIRRTYERGTFLDLDVYESDVAQIDSGWIPRRHIAM